MNKDRRKRITALISLLDDLKGKVEEIQLEEQEIFDNMPENLQGSERGSLISDAADFLQTSVDSIQEAINELESASQ